MLNEEKFIELLGSVSEIYKQDLSSMAIGLYYNTLKEYSYEQVEKALNTVIRTYKYNCMPKPAEIVEAIEGKESDRALIAWQSVIDTIRKHGYYQTIIFDDKIIHMCIEHLGGWMWICEQTIEDMKFISKDFMKLYSVLEKNPRKPQKKLIGYFELHNSEGGYKKDIPDPILIKSGKNVKLIASIGIKGAK